MDNVLFSTVADFGRDQSFGDVDGDENISPSFFSSLCSEMGEEATCNFTYVFQFVIARVLSFTSTSVKSVSSCENVYKFPKAQLC